MEGTPVVVVVDVTDSGDEDDDEEDESDDDLGELAILDAVAFTPLTTGLEHDETMVGDASVEMTGLLVG